MEAALAGGGAAAYADSVDSSPRSRSESWDEPYLLSSAPAKLRLMCSYGGHIVPRPHDKTLCYLGGETRIVVVDRHTTLSDLTSKLSRSLLSGRPFSLKYQLPSEDLDSLISVTTDEDLDNMIEEYDRIAAATGGGVKPSRIRLFLFPIKPDSTSSSISSLLDDSKSETWFVDALNGVVVGGNGAILPRGLSADSTGSSVNCLLGLEDDVGAAPPPPPAALVEQERPASPEKAAAGKSGVQDVQSVPDSPMLDTTSSFGSASSAPILSNLPPIRVRADDRGPPEEHFVQMNLLAQRQEEGAIGGGFASVHWTQSPPAVASVNPGAGVVASVGVATPPVISPTEDPTCVNRAFSSDEEKVEQGSVRKQQQQQPPQAAVVPPQNPSVFDVPIPQRIYYPDRSTAGVAGLSSGSDGKQEAAQNAVPESNYRVQMQPPEPSYLIPVQPEKFQQQPQQQQQQFHQPQQYVHANPQLMQHQSPTPVVPYQSFYQMQPQMHSQQQMPQTHPYNQQIPMFFVPFQNPNYGLPVQQHNLADTVGMTPQGKPALPMPNSVLQTQGVGNSSAKPEMVPAANLYRTNAPTLGAVAQSTHSPQLIHLADQTHQQFVSYHPMQQHPSQSVAAAGYRYEYGNPVHAPQVYYTQPTSAPLPSHFQTVSSGAATVISDAPSQLLQADVKQTRASS